MRLDADTYAGSELLEIAQLSAGGAVDAVDAVLERQQPETVWRRFAHRDITPCPITGWGSVCWGISPSPRVSRKNSTASNVF